MFTGSDPIRALLLGGLAALAAAAIACGDSNDDAGVSAQCEAFDGFASYRYSISVKMQLPPLQPGAPEPALGTYADSLAALLSDFQIEGAYVAPDRRQALLDFQGAQVELREVAGQRWERLGAEWAPLAEGAPTVDDLSPKVVCTDLVQALAPSMGRASADAVDINGVPTDHYSSEQADAANLAELLGVADESGLPEEFVAEAWFANDGSWPVRLVMKSQTTDPSGASAAVEFVMELRDVNDASIKIESPAPAAGG
jgi:hypothetical protein